MRVMLGKLVDLLIHVFLFKDRSAEVAEDGVDFEIQLLRVVHQLHQLPFGHWTALR